MPTTNTMQMPNYSNYGNNPGYTYPRNNQPVAMPQYAAPQYPQYTPSYSQPTSYYGYSYPEYDPSYEWYSNYYTTYPQQNLGYTGDSDAFGSQLCYWEDYGRSDCSFNPHQWVYDPYTGTYY